jgi:hypothetical protein
MPKPHRLIIDRVSGYADEATAYLRRRRHTRRPFARTHYPDGSGAEHSPDTEAGERLFAAAAELIELASR